MKFHDYEPMTEDKRMDITPRKPLGLFFEDIMPNAIDETIRQFQAGIQNTLPPRVIEVRTRHDAVDGACFENVRKQVVEFGGDICFGWRVNCLPFIYIYGEFHAVWKRPDGVLVDVSPVFPPDQPHVVFIEDLHLRYTGKRIPNRTALLWKVPEVTTFIEILNSLEDINTALCVAVNDGRPVDELWKHKVWLQEQMMLAWNHLRNKWNASIKDSSDAQ